MRRDATAVLAVVLVRLASVLPDDGRAIGFVFFSAALDDAVAEGGRRQALVICGAVIVLGGLAHVLAILLVRPVPAVVVSIADKVQRNANFAGACELVNAAFLISAAFVLVRSVASSAVVIRVALPRFGNAAARLSARELIGVARRVLAQGGLFVRAVVAVAIAVADPRPGHAADGPAFELIFAASDVLARAARRRVLV